MPKDAWQALSARRCIQYAAGWRVLVTVAASADAPATLVWHQRHQNPTSASTPKNGSSARSCEPPFLAPFSEPNLEQIGAPKPRPIQLQFWPPEKPRPKVHINVNVQAAGSCTLTLMCKRACTLRCSLSSSGTSKTA